MNATFYSLNKRSNSTLQPSGDGTVINVTLKDGADILRPVFRLNYSTMPAFNCIVFNGRTYRVTDIASVRNELWEVAAEVDVLATYKSNIQATTAFVVYDATANTEIIDNRLPTKTTAIYNEYVGQLNENASAAGSYLACVTGEDASHVFKIPNVSWLSNIISDPASGLAHYLSNEFPTIDQWSGDFLEGLVYYLKQTGKNLIGSGGNVFNNIRSIIWVPWRVETSQTASFDLGIFHTGAICSIVTTIFQNSSAQATIPWAFSDWRRNEPYTYVYLYLPFVGVIHIPSSQLIGQSTISVQIAFNQLSGEIAYRVYSGSVQVGAYGANTAISIPFGSSQVTPAQKVTALAGAAGGVGAALATGNVLAGAAAAASLAALRPIGASVGGIGGGAGGALDLNIRCFTVSHDTIVAPNSIAASIGTPSMAQKSLSGLSGFVQTRGASVAGTMTETERMQINELLDGGIFIE